MLIPTRVGFGETLGGRKRDRNLHANAVLRSWIQDALSGTFACNELESRV